MKEREYDVIDDDEEYKYLREMPIDSVIEENIEKLLNEKGEKEKELEEIRTTSIQMMWFKELNELEIEYDNYLKQRDIRQNGGTKTKKKPKKKTNKKTK